MSLNGSTDSEKLIDLCSKNHKEQIIWFLNSFWDKYEDQAERLFEWSSKLAELDLEHHEEGSSLDEMSAHRFLEMFKETMTVREMREKLRSTGAIPEGRVPCVPITHILIFRYDVDWRYLVNASQGDNKEEMAKAQAMLEEVQAAYQESNEAAGLAARALVEAESKEAASQRAAQEAKAKEDEARAAKEELEAALNELHALEAAFEKKKADLKAKSESGGVVSRNKAANELAQLLSEDPLPLRKAKITQAAVVKKAEKATQIAAASREAAEEASRKATQAKEESAQAKQRAEEALAEAKEKLAEAEAYLEEVKKRPGQAMGAIWWIERELHEAKKYIPISKGGITK